eukprot:UN02400
MSIFSYFLSFLHNHLDINLFPNTYPLTQPINHFFFSTETLIKTCFPVLSFHIMSPIVYHRSDLQVVHV